MRAGERFERLWAEIEDGAGIDEVAARHPASKESLLADLSAAHAVRMLGEQVSTPDAREAWEALEARIGVEEPRSIVRPHTVRRRSPMLVAAAAAVIAVMFVSSRALPSSPLYSVRRAMERAALIVSPRDTELHIRIAAARVEDLVSALTAGPVDAAPSLARDLVDERVAVITGGGDVSELDAVIAQRLPIALENAPPAIALEVRTVLGDLLPPGDEGVAPGNGNDQGGSGGHSGTGGSGQGTQGEGTTGDGGTGSTGSGDGAGEDSGTQDGNSQGGGQESSGGDSDSDGTSGDSGDSAGDGSSPDAGGSQGDAQDGGD